MGLEIIILAAGKGTRMQSELPKVLHKVAGQAMLAHVIETAQQLSPDAIYVVIGHGADQVKETFQNDAITWCVQEQQLGTGHAVQQALPNIKNDQQNVLILYGDVPLLKTETLNQLVNELSNKQLVLLSAVLEDPTGYGRIVRNNSNNVQAIVEQKDADQTTLNIKEINSGILAAQAGNLKNWLVNVSNNNTQQEYYLTDCIALAVQQKQKVEAIICNDENEVLGINNKLHLAQVERLLQLRIAEQLMTSGVTLIDPARIDVRGKLQTGKDVEIDINSVFIGDNILSDGVSIGANAVVINSRIEAGTTILANCHIENANIGKNCELGPFARIRPDTVLAENVKVGNFVEIKKANVKTGSKINHLSYIGDSDLGENVNIGAGTITCNYDGANKHRTTIGDNVFVGSDTQFIAPVTIGDGATIGAGSTITKDSPEQKLTLARSKQVSIDGWQRPEKKPK
ncbi:MAG: UDP-N-acetylglucosamine diphosphorylase/glucosamine-1-phosphate N-acetyltransferase [Gammaproteobacteria bacterium]|nr:MAG: UDP-N-acetylglucosamine diphosphorylase/glucosamine-1-phosphate N-acetyltransferase [Gammaproteobacteria bacterium]